MRIWLITVGEPLPTDGANERLLRTGLLAEILHERKHDIVWWSSTFDHVRKKQRFRCDTTIELRERYRLVLLHSFAYARNLSLRRKLNHYGTARKFARMARSEQKPDMIVCSYPTIQLSVAATEYGKKRQTPVVLDIRDLWPDLYLALAPRGIRWLARFVLEPLFRGRARACRNASAIVGSTSAFVDWGVQHAGRSRTTLDRVFPMGYRASEPSPELAAKAYDFWRLHNIDRDDPHFIACFFGVMGPNMELETLLEAAQQLRSQTRPIRFVLCGTGDKYERLKRKAAALTNVLMPGWVGQAEIWTLMRLSAVGLTPYVSNVNYVGNVPNKPIEYLSAGLPIVSSLQGALQELLESNSCGRTYANGDACALANTLIELHDNADGRRRMAAQAQQLFRNQFMAENVYTAMSQYLEDFRAVKG